MKHALTSNSYGKADVRLLFVDRTKPHHEVRDLSVTVTLRGEFDCAYVAGDNSTTLSTDAIKNTIYGLAREHLRGRTIEGFATAIAQRLLEAVPAAAEASIGIEEFLWSRLPAGAAFQPHSFEAGPAERWCGGADLDREGRLHRWGGIENLRLLKTTGSAFAGFMRDGFSTMADIRDRVFAPVLSVRWDWRDGVEPDDASRRTIRSAIATRFADHDESRSAQHTLYEVSNAVLEATDTVDVIRIRWPGRLHHLVDLTPFGQVNEGEVYLPVDQTPGFVEGLVTRADRSARS